MWALCCALMDVFHASLSQNGKASTMRTLSEPQGNSPNKTSLKVFLIFKNSISKTGVGKARVILQLGLSYFL